MSNHKGALYRSYYEVARSDLSSLYRALEEELISDTKRLITIIRLPDSEFLQRLEESSKEKEYLLELEADLEPVIDRTFTEDEWKRFDQKTGKLNAVDWKKYEADRIGPYIGVIEEIVGKPNNGGFISDNEVPF